MQTARSLTVRRKKSRQPLISIVVPVYNEEEGLPVLFAQLSATADSLPYRFEFIFVDDGSTDGSVQVLNGLAANDPAVRVIEFSRNFGKETAVTAGIHQAVGEAVIMIDADMQHPVSLIPKFLDKWQQGSEVVVGVRSNYGDQHIWKRATSWLFYWFLKRLSRTAVIPGSTDYRLIDRQVADAFNRLSERNRMTRGLIDWLGFRRDYIYFTPPPRRYGQPGYSIAKLFGLAVNSVVSLSVFPLRFAGYLGLGITLISGLAGLFILVEDFILGDPLGLDFSGPAMLAVLNMFWIGIVLSVLGLVSLYIASIHAEVVNRPLYVAREPATKPGKRRKTTKSK